MPCAGVPDDRLPDCAPEAPPTVDVLAPSVHLDGATRDGLAASLGTVTAPAGAVPGTCGPAVPVEITLGRRTRASRTLRTLARANDRGDRDTIRVRCERAP